MTTIPKSNLQIAFCQPVALCLLLDTSFVMPLKTIDALQIPKTNKSPQKENPLDDVVTLNGQLDKILAEAQKAQKEKERNKKKKKEEHGKKKTTKNLTKKNTKAKH